MLEVERDGFLQLVRRVVEQPEHDVVALRGAGELGELDALCIPVGNAGNITAYHKGFVEDGASPRLFGFQAAGAAPLVIGKKVAHPETVASAIRIGNPASWDLAIAARDESGGRIDAVTDVQILDAYRRLSRLEGVICEPSSAASVAGVIADGERVTYDLKPTRDDPSAVGTSEYADAIIESLET